MSYFIEKILGAVKQFVHCGRGSKVYEDQVLDNDFNSFCFHPEQ
jgi:hypothetical protein